MRVFMLRRRARRPASRQPASQPASQPARQPANQPDRPPGSEAVPRLPYCQGYLMGARCYTSNVDGFMGHGYLISKAILLPRLPYGCALLHLERPSSEAYIGEPRPRRTETGEPSPGEPKRANRNGRTETPANRYSGEPRRANRYSGETKRAN